MIQKEKRDRVWIVGGSSGIGLELVKIYLKEGFKLVVSSRNATQNENLKELLKEYPLSLYLIDIDVANYDFKDKISEAWLIYGGIDIWFYNASSYEVMGVDNCDKDKFIEMNSINYLGVVKMMSDLIHFFKTQGHGKWVWNLSSIYIFWFTKSRSLLCSKSSTFKPCSINRSRVKKH